MKLAKQRFSYAKYGAQKRNIQFLLSFEQWYDWWLGNGVDKNIPIPNGLKRNQYNELCMCRFNDQGPYTLNNIYCATRSQNSLDARKFNPAQNQRRSKPVKTPIGIFPSLTAAAKAYQRDITTIGHRLEKYPQDYYFL